MDHRTASGEVRGEPARPDLAERIAREVVEPLVDSGFVDWRKEEVLKTTTLIRESLAPIREALELADESLCCIDYGIQDHVEDAKVVKKALRLLRGEELSGNRGIDGGK